MALNMALESEFLDNTKELSQADALEQQIKLAASYAQDECRLHKLRRKKELTETESLQKEKLLEKHMTEFQLLELLARVSGVPIFSDPGGFVKTNSPSSAGPLPGDSCPVQSTTNSATAEGMSSSGLGKGPVERTKNSGSGAGSPSTGWKTVGKSTKRKADTILAKNSDEESTSDSESEMEVVNVRESQSVEKSNSNDKGTPEPKKPRIPPFYIVPAQRWDILLGRLRMLADGLLCKKKGPYFKLTCQTLDEYRAIQGYLLQEKVQFKTYLLEEQKQLKVVLRGLPLGTPLPLINEYLRNEGFEGVTVTQMFRGPVTKKIMMPLFHLAIPKQIELDRIFQITDFMGTEVSFEIYRGRKGPSQCFNCQGFFHSSSACKLAPRCVKCAEGYESKTCRKAFEMPCRCANCGGPHPANYRNCPKFPKSSPPKKGKAPQANNSRKIQNLSNSKPPSTFSSRKVESSRSFAGVATGNSKVTPPANVAPKTSPKVTPKLSVPSQDAGSMTDFINLLADFDKKFGSVRVLAAFKQALPALRKASTELDRVYILYESIALASP